MPFNPYIPQVWQFDVDYPSPHPTDEELGITHINVKSHDGTSWMSNFDRSPFAISGPDKWIDVARIYQDGGITMFPWVVPTGRSIEAEIKMASQIIDITNRMVFDVEYDSTVHFWKGSLNDIHRYMEPLRLRFPTARFTLQFDARVGTFTDVNLDAWMTYMDDSCGMDYWTDFGKPPITVLQTSRSRQARTRKPFTFTLPGNSSVFPDGIRQLTTLPEIYIWRRGTMTPECVQLVRSARYDNTELWTPPTSNPPPIIVTPPVVDTPSPDQRISDLYQEAVRTALRLDTIEEKLRKLGVVLVD